MRSGVKKYAGWCTRIPKSSSDDPLFVLFHFCCIFLIRLLAVPGQYNTTYAHVKNKTLDQKIIKNAVTQSEK